MSCPAAAWHRLLRPEHCQISSGQSGRAVHADWVPILRHGVEPHPPGSYTLTGRSVFVIARPHPKLAPGPVTALPKLDFTPDLSQLYPNWTSPRTCHSFTQPCPRTCHDFTPTSPWTWSRLNPNLTHRWMDGTLKLRRHRSFSLCSIFCVSAAFPLGVYLSRLLIPERLLNFTPDLSQLNPTFTPDMSQLNPNIPELLVNFPAVSQGTHIRIPRTMMILTGLGLRQAIASSLRMSSVEKNDVS